LHFRLHGLRFLQKRIIFSLAIGIRPNELLIKGLSMEEPTGWVATILLGAASIDWSSG
jgi:hypothetical protein